jgi:DNA invertase Pin-like site-specific DNA recombinase
MSKTKEKPIRFAALVRVSGEKQAKRGESLRTQTKQIRQAIDHLSGTIEDRYWYAGQEHATEGYEREMFDQMLADAQKKRKPFDAVMIASTSRWSRDSVRGPEAIRILRDNGIRFFVGVEEHSLHDPNAEFILTLYTAIAQLDAGTKKFNSMTNKIERAKRGWPACGQQPFGRNWNREREE